MVTETMGGWFPPTEVTLSAREHTYGSVLGSGANAMIIYYFHEGWNWDGLEKADSELNFDAPLDKDMNARPPFAILTALGKTLAGELGDRLQKSAVVTAPILIGHSKHTQYPLPDMPDAITIASANSAGLMGFFREAGYFPEVAFLEPLTLPQLLKYRLVVWEHPGYISKATLSQLKRYADRGGQILWIGSVPPASLRHHRRVIHRAKSPAEGWNGDDYPRLADAGKRIAEWKRHLSGWGLTPLVQVKTEDGLPYVHAWVKKANDGKGSLLFVENFLEKQRTVNVELNSTIGNSSRPANFSLLWGRAQKRSASGNRATLTLEPNSTSVFKLD